MVSSRWLQFSFSLWSTCSSWFPRHELSLTFCPVSQSRRFCLYSKTCCKNCLQPRSLSLARRLVLKAPLGSDAFAFGICVQFFRVCAWWSQYYLINFHCSWRRDLPSRTYWFWWLFAKLAHNPAFLDWSRKNSQLLKNCRSRKLCPSGEIRAAPA